jgi:hypothetical protein
MVDDTRSALPVTDSQPNSAKRYWLIKPWAPGSSTLTLAPSLPASMCSATAVRLTVRQFARQRRYH